MTPVLLRDWLSLSAEVTRLEGRWGKLESRLFDRRRAGPLDAAEEADMLRVMAQLRARIEVAEVAREALAPHLADQPAAGLAGLAAKLAILVAMVDADDQPDIHAMLLSLQRDLAAAA